MRAEVAALVAGEHLSESAAYDVFSAIVRGEIGDDELTTLLVALRDLGEQPEEVAGAARGLRDHALAFDRPPYRFADVVGTGGDQSGTINVSTAAAFVVAEAGFPVAKHGNRSVSSRCGAADLLERMGVRIDMPAAVARRCLDELGVTFLFAPHYHPGIRHAMFARKALGTRTIFNLLGPLVSPARPPIMLVGVYDEHRVRLVAEALAKLGCERALVVHGGGLDEIALHAPTVCCELQAGGLRDMQLSPDDFGALAAPPSAILGGSPEDNARLLKALLTGEGDAAHVDAVAVNAGALLSLAGVVDGFRDGYTQARAILQSGAAWPRLARFATLSQERA